MYSVNLISLPSKSIRRPEEHCGLAYLHAVLKQADIPVEIIDAYGECFDIDECRNRINNWCESVKNGIIAFSPYVTSYEQMLELGRYIKQNHTNIKIIAGGHFASLHRQFLLDNNEWLDGIIVGEGEQTLLEYCKNPNCSSIAGFYSRNGYFEPRERLVDLDKLPWQTRYISPSKMEGQPFSLVTSRGCRGNCSFCSMLSFYGLNKGPIQTYRSAVNIVNEIEYLMTQYKINSFKIVDDNFFRVGDYENKFLKEFVFELKSRNLLPIIRLSARPDDLTEERCYLLKEAGVEVVAIGAESAVMNSLELFNKKIIPDQSRKAARYLNKAGIRCLMNFITFDPLLTLKDLRTNYEFIKEHKDFCIFHRINSHLWLRSTDAIAEILRKKGLAQANDFPYVRYRYFSYEVKQIKTWFDVWCNKDNVRYYEIVDRLMAPDAPINEASWGSYQSYLEKDLYILDKLLKLAEQNMFTEKEARKIVEE